MGELVNQSLGKETSLTRSYLGVAAVLVPFVVLPADVFVQLKALQIPRSSRWSC